MAPPIRGGAAWRARAALLAVAAGQTSERHGEARPSGEDATSKGVAWPKPAWKHQLYMARQRQTGKAWSSAESDCGSCTACAILAIWRASVKPARPGPPRWLHRARSSRSCSRGHRADPRVPRACDVPIACRPPCACVDAILRSQTRHPSLDFTISDFEVRSPQSHFDAISCERVRTQFQPPSPEIEKDSKVTTTSRNRACQFRVVSKASHFQIQASNSAFNFDSETSRTVSKYAFEYDSQFRK